MKHHFDECVERVTGAAEGKLVDKKHPHEDCIEECKSTLLSNYLFQTISLYMVANIYVIVVFHLTHCATQCAAPKLWSVLK